MMSKNDIFFVFLSLDSIIFWIILVTLQSVRVFRFGKLFKI